MELVKEEKQELRSKIGSFAEMMAQLPDVKHGDSMPLKHSFAPGVYVREIFIPKDTVIVGKIHRHEHPNFLMSGEVSVVTENDGVQRLKAPMSMISPAGTKRIVYAHEDTVWITVHATDETDVAEIEKEVIVESYEMLDDDSNEVQRIIDTLDIGGNL